MVTGLPSADSLIPSIAALRRKLATEEVGFRSTIYPGQSTDNTGAATVNGMVEALTVSITSAYPPPTQTAFQTRRPVCGRRGTSWSATA